MSLSAQEWLAKVAGSDRPPVLTTADLPDKRILRELERSGALVRLRGEIVVVKRPTDSRDEAVRRLYWPIVGALLTRYAPAVVERDSAVRVLVGDETPPRVLRIRNGRNASNFEVALGGDLTVVVTAGAVAESSVRTLPVGDATVSVDESARILGGLELRFVRDNLDTISVWLRSLVLSRASIEAAYRDTPRPVVYRRIAHLAEDVGNERLAEALADVVRTNQDVRIGRGQTGVGTELIVPPLARSTPTTRRPWLDRLNLQIDTFREQIAEAARHQRLARPTTPLPDRILQAKEAKTHDVYHSTSIEGYRIRYEDVSVLLGGAPEGAMSEAEVRDRMAVLGYSLAFDNLLERIEGEGARLVPTTTMVLDLYVDLFSPSVEAGVVDPEMLRGWRTEPVFIRSSRYVPPAAERVGDMMNLLVERLADLDDPVVEAILGHLMLVSVHPFPDGNGRVGRFLMNAILLAGGWPWLTIHEGDRGGYFDSLKKAQLDMDARDFGVFVLERVGGALEGSGGV